MNPPASSGALELRGPGWLRHPGPAARAQPGTSRSALDPFEEGRATRWIIGFVGVQVACQLALLFEVFSAFRAPMRAMAFGTSLLLVWILRGQGERHPAYKSAAASIAIVGLGLLHPATNNLVAGLVHVGLYLAILGPLFWVGRLRPSANTLRSMLLVLWAFHSLGSLLGVLQVYFPGQFQPSLSAAVLQVGPAYVESLKIELPNGERTFRPMGLTDAPGGAVTNGFYAVLLGVGFLLSTRSPRLRALCLLSMVLGLSCVHLSYVRSGLVNVAVTLMAFGGVLALRRDGRRLLTFLGTLGLVGIVAMIITVSLGGAGALERMGTLVAEDPGSVYYENRGRFLDETINVLLPEYPAGAGLGRWGMVHAYFGDSSNIDSPPLWSEIQWTAWVFDGGVLLVLTYVLALLIALRTAATLALRGEEDGNSQSAWLWAALVFAYDVGALAITFNYPLFIGQGGLEFWLLNAVLFGAMLNPARPAPIAKAPVAVAG